MEEDKNQTPMDLMSEGDQLDDDYDQFEESYLDNFDESEALPPQQKPPSPAPKPRDQEQDPSIEDLPSPEHSREHEHEHEHSPEQNEQEHQPRRHRFESPPTHGESHEHSPPSHMHFSPEQPTSPPQYQTPNPKSRKTDSSPSIDTIKSILKKLFSFYSSFGNRLTSNKMNFTQFLKLATDACVLDSPQVNQQRLTLVFTRVNKIQSGLDYPKFVKVLHGIAQIKYKHGDSNEKFRSLLNRHILPLYETIYEETDMGTEDKILKSKISFPTLMLVHLKLGTLRGIYERFFKSEMSKNYMISDKKMFKLSRQDLLTFLRDFELLPSLVNNSLASNFYQEVFHIDSWVDQMGAAAQSVHDLAKILAGGKGLSFTFFKFVFFLIKLSMYVFSDPNNLPRPFRNISFTHDEKFYLLLERMEVSQGFLNVCLTHVKKLSHPRLVLNAREIIEMHKETNAFPNFEDFLERSKVDNSPWMLIDFVKQEQHLDMASSQNLYEGLMGPRAPRERMQGKSRGASALKKKKRKTVPRDVVPEYVLKFKEELFKLFSKYAVFRNKEPKLNNFKFIKLLQDANIVKITSRLEKLGPSPPRTKRHQQEGT